MSEGEEKTLAEMESAIDFVQRAFCLPAIISRAIENAPGPHTIEEDEWRTIQASLSRLKELESKNAPTVTEEWVLQQTQGIEQMLDGLIPGSEAVGYTAPLISCLKAMLREAGVVVEGK